VASHDLRHAFGVAAITMLNSYAVESQMGHQRYSTTLRYLHHQPRREDAAALAEASESTEAERPSQAVTRAPSRPG
jgi:integrase